MLKFKLSEIKKILNIKQETNECTISYVSDDIKKITNDSVIFHVKKDTEVNEKKFSRLTNCYIVTDQPLLKGMINKDKYLFVDNVLTAYRTFVTYYRNLFHIPVVAVTGTCGKTTTKEMISQVLKNKYKVVHTISSKNALRFHNDYLMSFDYDTQVGVFETAITHPGNLIYTCEFFKPSIGIITTIGIDHLNWCKTLDNYIRTKGELLTGLGNQGTLIINQDDSNIKKIDMSHYQGEIITFGIEKKADFFASNISYTDKGMTFDLHYRHKAYPVFIPVFGDHNIYNALATIAATVCLGMKVKEAIYYLGFYQPIRSHVEFKKGINGSIIIDDTWSSNPTSMKAALKVLNESSKDKVKIAVIGKISYLGEFESKSYDQIARMLIKNKVDILVTQDINAKEIGTYALARGFDSKNIIHCEDKESLKNTLASLLNEKTIALFKWSMLDKTNQEVLKSLVVEEHID